MRVKKSKTEVEGGDLTPMIDMTFQLIAFFMVLINFSQTETNERIQLPNSELAKPPDGPLDYPITLHLTKEGTVIMGAEEVAIVNLRPLLLRETAVMGYKNMAVSEATIIIRGHRDAQMGRVQEVIKICQAAKFETFALRAKEKVQ